jgi:hypothetical protein
MQEIITTLWRTSGVTGVAIWELHDSQCHIFTKRRLPNWEKQAISQIIQQNLNEYAENTNHCQFTVMGNHAHVYIKFPFPPLIILTQSDAFIPAHVADLHIAIQEDYQQVIRIFQELVNIELTQPSHKFNLSIYTNSEKSTEETTTIQELVNFLNELATLCTKYMGQNMTIKYLERNRPNDEWLSNFQINKFHQIIFVGNAKPKISSQQKKMIQQWVKGFLDESSAVFVYLPTILQKSTLTDQLKCLLLS